MAGMIMEEFCDECDDVLNAVVDADAFWKFKVGRIRCLEDGCVVLPCNECLGSEYHGKCGDCPWRTASIVNAMTDKELMLWFRANDTRVYNMFKGDKMGDHYHEVIREIEAEETKNEKKQD